MKKFLKVATIILCPLLAFLLAAGCGTPGKTPSEAAQQTALSQPSEAPQEEYKPSAARLSCLYYDSELVDGGIAAPGNYEVEEELTAGLIPHHLLASDMIAGFFAMAAQQQPYDAILIVSPSHFAQNCGSLVTTANVGWDTPFGRVEADGELAAALLGDEMADAEDNPRAVELDHGAAGLVPFAAYYLPDTPVTVCLLSNRLSRQRLEAVRQVVRRQRQSRRVLLIASADCSHYQTPEEAARRDQETIAAFEQMAQERILSFTDANIDSPQAAMLLLDAAGEENANLALLDHSASWQKLPHGPQNPIYHEGVTSYLTYAVTHSSKD